MARFSEELHRPIEFYGKVVDTHDAPIGGASITLVWSHFLKPEGTNYSTTTYNTNIFSDAQGLFSLTGVVGATLGVQVQKQFYIKFGNPPKFGRLSLSSSAFYSGATVSYLFNPDGSRYLEPAPPGGN
jgi:hypothetical protein